MNRPGFVGGFNSCEGGAITSKAANKFAPEVREQAVRMVFDHERVIRTDGRPWYRLPKKSAASRRRCMNGQGRQRQAAPVSRAEVAEKVKALEREVRELRQANEILRKASAYFAQAEIDHPFRR